MKFFVGNATSKQEALADKIIGIWLTLIRPPDANLLSCRQVSKKIPLRRRGQVFAFMNNEP